MCKEGRGRGRGGVSSSEALISDIKNTLKASALDIRRNSEQKIARNAWDPCILLYSPCKASP